MEEDAATVPLVGGHPALDLVNTVAPRAPEPDAVDYLVDPAALLVWAGRAGLLDAGEAAGVEQAWAAEPAAAQAALSAAKEVREALAGILLDEEPAGAALERLHLRWAAAAGRSALVPDPGGRRPVRLAVGLVPALLIPDRAANAALDLLNTADFGRLRRCPREHGGCGWLFLDRSRNGSRRWCAMSDCGTQVKARRLTQRRRAARDSATG